MINAANYRFRCRHLCVCAVLFFAANICTRAEIHASCGDYLLHGAVSSGDDAPMSESTGGKVHWVLTSEAMPTVPASNPCANGGCRQTPVPHPHPNSTRSVICKQVVVGLKDTSMARDGEGLCCSRVCNDALLSPPFAKVELQPPIDIDARA
jgi:hypothetical protein